MNHKISIIAAIGKNRELGKNNKLLWHIPEDLARFKKITSGHPVIMGRRTFQSIGKPLPNRLNIVVTHDKNFQAPPSVLICNSLEKALNTAKKQAASVPTYVGTSASQGEIFIIGGASIYQQTIPYANKLYLTIVEASPQCKQHSSGWQADTLFPHYSAFKKVIYEEKHQNKRYTFTFFEIER